jgi:hypothetical protein
VALTSRVLEAIADAARVRRAPTEAHARRAVDRGRRPRKARDVAVEQRRSREPGGVGLSGRARARADAAGRQAQAERRK